MEKLLNEDVTVQVKDVLAEMMQNPVKVLFFSGKENCDYCDQTKQLLEEIVTLNSALSIENFDIDRDDDVAKQYAVSAVPAIVIAGVDNDQLIDYGIRFLGIPAGHEFTSLINSILLVSSREPGLKPATREFLAKLDKEIYLRVFVTPTCPYCPRAVTLAHSMALESPFVQAEMIEANEFASLSNQYGVSGVPHTAINDGEITMIGSGPEEMLVEEIKKYLN